MKKTEICEVHQAQEFKPLVSYQELDKKMPQVIETIIMENKTTSTVMETIIRLNEQIDNLNYSYFSRKGSKTTEIFK